MKKKAEILSITEMEFITKMFPDYYARYFSLKSLKFIRKNGLIEISLLSNFADMGISKDILLLNISDMNLTVRAKKALKSFDLLTVHDLLVYKTENELLGMRNFSKRSLYDLKEELKKVEKEFFSPIPLFVGMFKSTKAAS